MNTVTKEITFEAAHRLSDYDGKCKRIHGHSYKVELTAYGELNKLGMVVDFGDLKKILNKYVFDAFDHRLILKMDDEYNHKVFESMPDGKEVITWVPFNPTAENLARYLFDTISLEFSGLQSIRLYETATSWVEVTR